MNKKLTSFSLALLFSAVLCMPVVAAGAGSNGYVIGISPAAAEVQAGAAFQTAATLSSDSSDGEIQGWSYGICHDETHYQLDSIGDADTATVQNGAPAGFNEIGTFANGYTQGVVICFTGCATVAAGTTISMTNGNYTAIGSDGDSSDIAYCDSLGIPPVAIAIVTGGASLSPSTNSATITIVPPPPTLDFIRGDTNQDGGVNIADGIWLLAALFNAGSSYDCVSGSDANDDDTVDAADAIYIFNYVFLGGAEPSAPFSDCGQEAGQQPEDCEESNWCAP